MQYCWFLDEYPFPGLQDLYDMPICAQTHIVFVLCFGPLLDIFCFWPPGWMHRRVMSEAQSNGPFSIGIWETQSNWLYIIVIQETQSNGLYGIFMSEKQFNGMYRKKYKNTILLLCIIQHTDKSISVWFVLLTSRPGQSQGPLYKHLCHSFIN